MDWFSLPRQKFSRPFLIFKKQQIVLTCILFQMNEADGDEAEGDGKCLADIDKAISLNQNHQSSVRILQ